MRGPSRARMMSSSTPSSSNIGDSRPKAYLMSTLSRHDPDFSQSNPSHHPTEYKICNYVPSSAAPRHHTSSPSYLGTETRSYSEPRAMHLPHWADVRRPSANIGLASYGSSSQSQMSTAPRDAIGMGYDPYQAFRQPQRRHDPLSARVPSSSSFLLEAQESPRYNGGDLQSVHALLNN